MSFTSPEPLPSQALQQKKNNFEWPWGVASTTGIAVLLFILPQIFVLLVAGLVLSESQISALVDSENIYSRFGILLAGEIATLGLLKMVLFNRGKKFSDIYLVKTKIRNFIKVIPAYFTYLFISTFSFLILSTTLSDDALDQGQDVGFSSATSTDELITTFIGLAILVPIVEELIFRGFVFKGFLRSMSWKKAAFFSSLLFAFAHMQLNVGIDTFILGLSSCWLVYQTKSIWPSIVLHMIKNSVAFAFLFGNINL